MPLMKRAEQKFLAADIPNIAIVPLFISQTIIPDSMSAHYRADVIIILVLAGI